MYINMKIRYLLFIIFLMMPLSAWSASYVAEIGGICYNLYDDYASASVVEKGDGTKYSGDIVIPEEITYDSNTYIVKSVGGFRGCDELLSIKLPKTIESMGAFSGCTKLKEIVIPDLVTWIEPNAFENCSSLEKVTLGENVTNIDRNAFINCTSLESITIGKNVTRVGNSAFFGCKKLKSVYISDLQAWCRIQFYEESIYGYPWYDKFTSSPLENGADLYLNGEIVSELTIPDNIENVLPFAFCGCTSIKKLTVPESVRMLYHGAFDNCCNLQNVDLYFNGRYKRNCFADCTSLENLNFYGECSYEADTYPSYYIDAFENCINLKRVVLNKSWCSTSFSSYNINALYNQFPNVKDFVIPEGVTDLLKGLFWGYESLNSITVPSTITQIEGGLDMCDKIIISDINAWCNIKFSNNDVFNGADLYVNDDRITELIIPESITAIPDYAFSGCNSITKVLMGNSVVEVGSSAFQDCKNIKYVKLPGSITKFGRMVFYGCEELVSTGPYQSNCAIEYGWTKNIPEYALCDVYYLQKIIISSTIEYIGDNAFAKLSTEQRPISQIYTNATVPPEIFKNTFFSIYNTPTLFVPRDCKEAYSNAPYWKDFNIIELVDVESVTLGKEKYGVIVGESKTIDVTILPEKATYKDLYWSIEDPEIAQVDNGVVVGLKTGTTKLTATTTDGTNISASCVISVTNPVQSIVLSKDYVELEAEDTETITATCSPANADDITVTWKSMDGSVATVTNGVIKAVKVGETDIVAQSFSGIKAKCRVVVKPTIATSLSLNKHSLNLNTGNTERLELDILPMKTTNKSVSWRSDAPTVASVDDYGMVTAKSNGTAKITVTTTDGSNISEECTVMVTTLATGISLNKENSSLIVGQTLSLTAYIAPTETSNKSVKWESNNTSCATVSPTGLVTALSTGTATISATTKDGTAKSASCVVVVTNPVISLTLDKTVAEMKVGQHITITATCVPSNADNTNVTWRSSNEDVVSVDNGIVTAKKLGNATITASSVNGLEAKCSINVVPTPVTSLSINKTSINLAKGDNYELVCTVFPDNATNKEIVWKSNDSSVAVVDNGIVTAVSTGSTSIVATSKSNSNLSVSCRVIVTTPVIALNLDYEAMDLYVEDNVQLRATCSPKDADNKMLTWSSNNEDVATVSSNGYVSTKNEGKALITATTTDGSNISASCDINVKKREQNITWNQDLSLILNGGEMILLDANASSDLPVSFVADNNNVVSIFDLGDKVYLNPMGCGKTYISAYQQGNYKYESTELRKDIEVIGNVATKAKTLVVYYSQSPLIDGIIAVLANQLSGLGCSVNMQKIEPTNGRINEANVNKDVRDSVMTVIGRFPNDLNSYPSINGISVNINEYDDVIMVYPLWNSEMAAPMQTFSFMNKDILGGKSFAYIEYDLFGDAGSSSNIKTLRLNTSNIDDKSDIIREWLNSESTGILQFRAGKDKLPDGIYDLQGRRMGSVHKKCIYIINGVKEIKW